MPSQPMPSPPTLFPTYLVPSVPFRRRQSSIDSNASIFSTSTSASPPAPDSYLSGHASHLRCARCLSDLALSSQIISKGFTGRHGRAYLVAPSTSASSSPPSSTSSSSSTFSSWMTAKARNDALPNLPNTYTHKPVPRQLVTGAHTVGDISCAQCGSVLGWKYIHAEDESQKYKIGKFILETKRVCRSSTWETADTVDEDAMLDGVRRDRLRRRSSAAACPPTELVAPLEELEFDSEDEEEREALFMGMWTPQVAAKIRREKAAGFTRGVLMEEE